MSIIMTKHPIMEIMMVWHMERLHQCLMGQVVDINMICR